MGSLRLYPLALVVAAALAACVAAPQPARSADPALGIGEQHVQIFGDPWWHALELRRVRYIAAWDALQHPAQLAETDAYMAAARAAGAQVLLGFGHSRVAARAHALPSLRAFRRQFLAFRARYPWVREYLTWNEANHCSQPTCRRPRAAARFYNTLRANCRGCTIVAADVLDTTKMPGWVRAFRRHADGRRLIWGLHNYIDANRFRTRGTRSLLRAVRGDVWFTETGGLVERSNGSRIEFPGNVWHQARATRWLFQRLVPLSSRVRRVYLYQWNPVGPDATWDSALVDAAGRPRPAYHVLRQHLRAAARRAAR